MRDTDNVTITDTVAYHTKIMRRKEKNFFFLTIIMWCLAIISRIVTTYLFLPFIFIFIQNLLYVDFMSDYYKYDYYPVSKKRDKFYCKDLLIVDVFWSIWSAYNAIKFIYQVGEHI